MNVRKRSGKLVKFDPTKIKAAMLLAFAENGEQGVDVGPIVQEVCRRLQYVLDTVDLEIIGSLCEECINDAGFFKIAKAWAIHRARRTDARERRLGVLAGELGHYISASKYARCLVEKKRRETSSETIRRSRDMHLQKMCSCDPSFLMDIGWAFNMVQEHRVLPSMRSMQFAGAKILKHNESLYNCAGGLCDRVAFFEEEMFLLLCGCGVGASYQFEHVRQIPKINRGRGRLVRHFVVPDTIEGWAQAVGFMARAYVEGYYPEISYCEIRDKGTPLIVTGGLAPGHLGLKQAIERTREIYERARGRALRPIECNDISCWNSSAVLSGGIRRSSKIALFSHFDSEFLYAKAHENFGDGKNPQRALCNNSMALRPALRGEIRRCIEVAYENAGCPGFFVAKNKNTVCNPCGEIAFDPRDETGHTGWGFCNLVEINLARCEGKEELLQAARAAAIIGTVQATYTDFTVDSGVLNPRRQDSKPQASLTPTQQIAARDRLLGVSMTGIWDAPDIAFDDSTIKMALYTIKRENARVAEILGIEPAARLTCVKPSGTASCFLGSVGNGIHPHHARRYFRRVTANVNERAAQHFRSVNPHMVDVKEDGDLSLVFPVEAPESAILKSELSGIKFLDAVERFWELWIEPGTVRGELRNNISCTLHYEENEFEELVQRVIESPITGLTFVSMDFDDRWTWAPFKEVKTQADEAKWNEICSGWKRVDWGSEGWDAGDGFVDQGAACEGGACSRKGKM